MQQYSKFSGSECRRCGAERAIWPSMHDDELHCVICGASYYVQRVGSPKTTVSSFVSEASARQEATVPNVVRRSRRLNDHYLRTLSLLRS